MSSWIWITVIVLVVVIGTLISNTRTGIYAARIKINISKWLNIEITNKQKNSRNSVN